jgi:hypothetical protein
MSEHPNLSLLRAILDVGEQIVQALNQRAFEQLSMLAQERSRLLEQLQQHPLPEAFDPELEVLRVALSAQHRRLNELLTETERQLARALLEVEQYKRARHHYQAKTSAMPQPVLRENLLG